jgi:hypothetical protein
MTARKLTPLSPKHQAGPRAASTTPPHRRSHHAAQVEHGGIQGDGVHQVPSVLHHLHCQGLAGGGVKGVGHAQGKSQHSDMPDLQDASSGQSSEDERAEHHCRLRPDQEGSPGDPVGHGASREHQEKGGDSVGEGDGPQCEPGARNLIDDPPLGNGLHPGAHQGKGLTDEPEPIVSVSQGCKSRETAPSRCGDAGWLGDPDFHSTLRFLKKMTLLYPSVNTASSACWIRSV